MQSTAENIEQQQIALSTATELSLPERAIAAMKLQITAAQLSELASKTADIKAITNPDGRKQAHAAAMVLADKRIEIDKAGKAARDDANKFSRQVIVEKDKLISLIEPEEKRLLALRDEWDAKIEAERRAKVEAEHKRIASIRARIEEIKALPATFANHPAAQIEQAVIGLVALAIDATFQEFQTAAEEARQYILTKLRQMLADRQAHEAEQQRLRVEREELARQRAAQAEANRIERERIAAEEAAARLKREAEEAEARRQREAAEAAAAAERKRRLDEELARLRAEREEQEWIAKAERERQRVEQQRLDQEREAAQAEQVRIAAEQQRQAEELRRQQDAIAAERAELERQQQQLAATQAPAPADSPPSDEPPQKEWQPSAADLIGVIAADYGVTHDTAARWLRDAFAPVLV